MNPQTLSSTMAALRKAGSVFGVIFSNRNEVIYSDVPFVPERVSEMATVLDDIAYYFNQEGRNPDQLAFGYDGGNLLICFNGVFRLIVLHSLADEVDFIAKACRAFLKDYQMSLFSEGLVSGISVEEARASLQKNQIAFADDAYRDAQMEDGEADGSNGGEPSAIPREATERISAQADRAREMTEPIQPRSAVPKTEPIRPPKSQEASVESGVPSVMDEPQETSSGYAVETPMTEETVLAIEDEFEETERENKKEATGPILAPHQPESTLPAPRRPKIKR